MSASGGLAPRGNHSKDDLSAAISAVQPDFEACHGCMICPALESMHWYVEGEIMKLRAIRRPAVLPAVVLAVALASPVSAQNMSLGEFEYMNSCSACHGADGKGNGSITGYLNQSVPDLTMLQKNNDGVFPVTSAYSFIAGGAEVGAHGTRDMPAWGRRYMIRAANDPDFLGGATQEYTNLRILALIEHLASIQEK